MLSLSAPPPRSPCLSSRGSAAATGTRRQLKPPLPPLPGGLRAGILGHTDTSSLFGLGGRGVQDVGANRVAEQGGACYCRHRKGCFQPALLRLHHFSSSLALSLSGAEVSVCSSSPKYSAQNMNWAGCFINCIKHDAARLKDELACGASSMVINFCPSILQVFYLDNMSFGELSPAHDVFPRINVTHEMLCLLIGANTEKDFMSSLDMYEIAKASDKTDICYSRCVPGMSGLRGAVGQKPNIPVVSQVEDSGKMCNIADMIHHGMKIIDEHGAKCSEWLAPSIKNCTTS